MDSQPSGRGGSSTPSVLLDMRPLQGPSGARGIGSYARGLLAGLVELGFDKNLCLLLDVAFDEPHDLPPGAYRLVGSRRRYHGRLSGYEEAVALGGDLQRLGPDVYHAIDLRLPGRSPCPIAVTLHDLIPWSWGGTRMRGERMRYWLGRRLLGRADAVLVPSKSTASDAERYGRVPKARVRVIPEAADPAFIRRPGAEDRVRQAFGLAPGFLLFTGALDARKDPSALLEAWRAVREVRPEVELVVVGAAGAQAPSQMPGARRLGWVEQPVLADLYSAAGCLVFPSRYEGFGLPCLEAMACGCPVAAFRNSSLPEVVANAGSLVDDGDAGALGRAAASMLADPDPWRKAGLKRAAQFSWKKAAGETIAVYESLLR